MIMNIATEAKLSGRPVDDKGRTRPVRMVRWFVIVGALLVLVLIIGAVVFFGGGNLFGGGHKSVDVNISAPNLPTGK